MAYRNAAIIMAKMAIKKAAWRLGVAAAAEKCVSAGESNVISPIMAALVSV
jgi:hypothetical protein